MTSGRRVVIIGGGFGGLTAARVLGGSAFEVTLIDRCNHHLFQPLLYQVATAGLSPAEIASPLRFILRRHSNVRVLLAEARGIELHRGAVVLDQDEVPYDVLIVATGSTHSYFAHDDWATVAPGLKTLDDALAIRRKILLAFERAERARDEQTRRRALTFVIIGGGATGVELAGALAEIARHALRREFRAIRSEDATIVLLEGGASLLPAFPPDLRVSAARALASLGVTVRCGASVTSVAPGVVEGPGFRVEADTILWAAGVRASSLGGQLSEHLDRVGRVVVGSDLSLPGHPNVFVIGDLAHVADEQGDPMPAVAPVAMQQGRYVAERIRSSTAGHDTRPFRYVNFGNLATIGRARAVADFGWFKTTGMVAWLLWVFVHILKLTGFRNRFFVLLHWVWAYVTFQRSARLITGAGR